MTKTTALLMTALLTGCAASTSRGDNWAYTGSDPDYRLPLMPRGGLTNAEWQLDIQQKMADWQRRSREAIEESKAACAGESSAFMACMKARGWARMSNPL